MASMAGMQHATEHEAQTEPTRRRFTVDEYHRMGEAGILHEDDRVELIEGELIVMSPIGPRHASTVRRVNRLLGERAGSRGSSASRTP